MCRTHVSTANIQLHTRTHVSDTCVGHMYAENVFIGYTKCFHWTHVSDTCVGHMCRTHVSSKCFHWTHVSDTCVGHMCRTHVSSCVAGLMFMNFDRLCPHL